MNDGSVQMTRQTIGVLSVLIENPARPFYGFELMAHAKVKSGTLYPMLARLEKAGWITSSWEEVDPHTAARPRRRYYRLTSAGHLASVAALQGATKSKQVQSELNLGRCCLGTLETRTRIGEVGTKSLVEAISATIYITCISRTPIEATVGNLVDARLPLLRGMALADGDKDECRASQLPHRRPRRLPIVQRGGECRTSRSRRGESHRGLPLRSAAATQRALRRA